MEDNAGKQCQSVLYKKVPVPKSVEALLLLAPEKRMEIFHKDGYQRGPAYAAFYRWARSQNFVRQPDRVWRSAGPSVQLCQEIEHACLRAESERGLAACFKTDIVAIELDGFVDQQLALGCSLENVNRFLSQLERRLFHKDIVPEHGLEKNYATEFMLLDVFAAVVPRADVVRVCEHMAERPLSQTIVDAIRYFREGSQILLEVIHDIAAADNFRDGGVRKESVETLVDHLLSSYFNAKAADELVGHGVLGPDLVTSLENDAVENATRFHALFGESCIKISAGLTAQMKDQSDQKGGPTYAQKQARKEKQRFIRTQRLYHRLVELEDVVAMFKRFGFRADKAMDRDSFMDIGKDYIRPFLRITGPYVAHKQVIETNMRYCFQMMGQCLAGRHTPNLLKDGLDRLVMTLPTNKGLEGLSFLPSLARDLYALGKVIQAAPKEIEEVPFTYRSAPIIVMDQSPPDLSRK
ncbi:MAG: hypothetical protein ACI9BD_000823 [Candidatus Marinamargulisbacteria bacterium]|jgi:hypothetical protein